MENGLLPEDSHVKTYPLLEKGQDLTVKSPVYGLTMLELLAIYDHDMQSWKMSGSLFDGEWSKFWGVLPKWGIMRNGEIYPLQASGLVIKEKGIGLLPTPRASDGIAWSRKSKTNVQESIQKCLMRFRDVSLPLIWMWNQISARQSIIYTEMMMGYPKGWTDLKDSEMQLSLK